jgi:hypothetical protein
MWLCLASLLLVTGSVGSFVAASAVVHNDRKSEQQQFVASSADIALNLQLAIQHQIDLVDSAQTFVLGKPGASESEFVAWAKRTRVMARYPDLQGIGLAQIIYSSPSIPLRNPPEVESAGGHAVHGAVAVVAPGNRPFYCFIVVGFDRTPIDGLPQGFDLCAGARGERFSLHVTAGGLISSRRRI